VRLTKSRAWITKTRIQIKGTQYRITRPYARNTGGRVIKDSPLKRRLLKGKSRFPRFAPQTVAFEGQKEEHTMVAQHTCISPFSFSLSFLLSVLLSPFLPFPNLYISVLLTLSFLLFVLLFPLLSPFRSAFSFPHFPDLYIDKMHNHLDKTTNQTIGFFQTMFKSVQSTPENEIDAHCAYAELQNVAVAQLGEGVKLKLASNVNEADSTTMISCSLNIRFGGRGSSLPCAQNKQQQQHISVLLFPLLSPFRSPFSFPTFP